MQGYTCILTVVVSIVLYLTSPRILIVCMQVLLIIANNIVNMSVAFDSMVKT